LNYLKIYVDIDMKIITLNHQNNNVRHSNMRCCKKFWHFSNQLERFT